MAISLSQGSGASSTRWAMPNVSGMVGNAINGLSFAFSTGGVEFGVTKGVLDYAVAVGESALAPVADRTIGSTITDLLLRMFNGAVTFGLYSSFLRGGGSSPVVQPVY